MADPNAPYGFRPFVRMGGGPFSQVEYGKSASDPHSIMAFDLVGLYPGEDVPWPPDDPLRHLPRIRTGSQLVPGTSLWLGCSMGYAAGGVASVHAVVDQFDVIFHAQCSGNVAITNAQHAGMTANVLNTPGSDIQKLSVHQIDSSTLGSLPGADIKIRMLSTQRPNMEGPNAIVEVMINKHEGARDVGVATTTTVGVVKPDNTTITVAPDGTLHATGGTAASQTPWTSNIDGGAHSLSNVQDITTLGNILAGNNLYYTGNISPESMTGSIITNGFFAAASPDSYFSLQGRTIIDWDQVNNVARFSGGTLLLNNGLGIGVGRVPAYPVDVMGDVNVSGVFRVNGVPLTGQTPWKNNIDGGGHSLSNVSAITASSLNVQTITASGAVTTGNLTSSGVIQANLIGLGKAPAYPVDVLGDVNVSGVFRVNGTPIVTTGQPQTPWAQTVDAAAHNLNNVPFVTGNGSLTLDAGPAGTGTLTLQAGNSNISFRTNNVQRGFFSALGTLGINAPTAGFAIDAAGIIHSSTGGIQFPDNTVQVTAAGAPIAQTPWQSNIDAANHNLTNIQQIDSGAGTLSLLTSGKTRMLITSTGAYFLSGDTTVNIQCTQPIGWSTSLGNIILQAQSGIQLNGGAGNIDLTTAAVTCSGNVTVTGSVGASIFNVATTLFAKFSAGTNIAVTCDTVKATTSVNIGAFVPAGVNLSVCSANVTTPAAATQFRICEATANPLYGLNIGFYLDSVAGSYKGVIQGNTGSPIGPLLLNPLGGSVGVGMASPVSVFEVAPSATNSAIKTGSLELQSVGLNNSYVSDNTYYNSGWYYRATGLASQIRMYAGGFDFYTAGSGAAGTPVTPVNLLSIASGGNVGIGTPTPNGKLHLVTLNTAGVNGTAPLVLDRTYGDVGDYQDIVFGSGGGNTSSPGRAGIIRSIAHAGGESGLAFYTQTAGGDAANHQSVMILGNGKVGIGISAPTAALSLGGTLGDKLAIYEAPSVMYGIGMQSGVMQIYASDSVARVGIGYGPSASFTEVLSVRNGNVGIGQINPAVKLDIISNDSTDTGGAIRILPSNLSQNATYSFGGITGSYFFKIQSAVSQFISLNAAGGKVGIGTTTPATTLEVASTVSDSGIKTGGIQLQSVGVNNSYICENLYFNGSGWIYRAAGFGSMMRLYQGGFDLLLATTAAAGTGATLNLAFSVGSGGAIAMPLLPSVNPGAGSHCLWYDPADGNRVKYAV